MASDFAAHLDSLKLEELVDVVSYLCLMPRCHDGAPITHQLVRHQRRRCLVKLIADFMKDPAAARQNSSKSKIVMTKEGVVEGCQSTNSGNDRH